MMLSQALLDLADTDDADPVMVAGTLGSASTLNEGVFQETRITRDPELLRKHRARLRSALRAMAAALVVEERSAA